jgi:DNA-binding HxlR family transcriptional regulator
MQKGIGEYQIKKAKASKKEILKVLQDGQWHRYNKIKEATGLSSATLSKHLEELTNGIVEKKLDLESKQYPYPVLYRLKPKFKEISQRNDSMWRNFLLSYLSKSSEFWLKSNKPEKPFVLLSNLAILGFTDLLKDYIYEKPTSEFFEQAFEHAVLGFFEEGLRLIKQKLETLEPQKRLSILEKIEENLAGVKIYE